MAKRAKKNQLAQWADDHKPDDDLIYRDGYWDQIKFVRDRIPPLLSRTSKEESSILSGIKVVSEHISKSVLLPVFRVELPDGTAFTMRYNFHNWIVSVESPRDVDVDFMALFYPKKRIHPVYCEGFPQHLIFGPYAENKQEFTLDLGGDYYCIFTFFWIFGFWYLTNQKKCHRKP